MTSRVIQIQQSPVRGARDYVFIDKGYQGIAKIHACHTPKKKACASPKRKSGNRIATRLRVIGEYIF